MKIGNSIISLEISLCKSTDTCEEPVTKETIEKCIRIAMDAHEGQRDKNGNPVILHPMAVGLMGKTDAEMCVGFLHDVVEDSDYTFDDLRNEDIPEQIVSALELLTHEKDMDYFDYVQGIIDSGNQLALAVKTNDLHHNLARGKASGLDKIVEKHEKALAMIEKSKKI